MAPAQKFLYAHYAPNSGCDFHRISCPFRHLAGDFPDLDFDLSLTDPNGQYQWHLTHGNPPVSNYRCYGKWKRQGGRWLWSLDDDMPAVPDWNPAKLSDVELDCWYASRDLADAILSSTPALTAAIGKPTKTITVPNLMQVADYNCETPAPAVDGETLRVLWAGSKTHSGDLEEIEEAADQIIRKYGPQRVQFVFVGFAPGRLLRDWSGKGCHFESGVSLAKYPSLINAVRPHLVLAPLKSIPFNASKSNIRVLEGWACAAAVVASNYGEYAVIHHGEDGLLVSDGDWFSPLDRLLSDRDYREQLATAGRKRVADFDWANPTARSGWRQAITQLQSLAS